MFGNLGFKKGFTLLELIVAMAIIAVLIGLSLLGIQTVQRSARDTERRTALEAANLEITDYYGNNGDYPADGSVTINRTVTPARLIIGSGGKYIELKGASTPLAASATATTSAGAVFCYTKTGSTYSIGVQLESGSWFNLGNSTTNCNSADL